MSPRPVLLAAALVLAAAVAPAAATAATSCTDMPQRGCLYPFPNDAALTKPDKRTPTGLRVALPAKAMPKAKDGTRVDPTEWNRNDGFSPGQPIVLRIPGVTTQEAFRRTGLNDVTDIGRSLAKRSRLVLADARTGERVPAWAELDALAERDANRMVVIHPARNLRDGRTYLVALRDIGRPRPPRFAEDRSAKLDAALRKAGLRRGKDLYLAWTFTVASTKGLTGRMLHLRDDAFAKLGDRDLADGEVAGRTPAFAITSVTEVPLADDPKIARKIAGTIDVPCYLTSPGCATGGRFRYASKGKDALPAQQPGNVHKAAFVCNIPRSASAAKPAALSLYGHGLLGRATEIDAGNVRAMSNEHNWVFCATPWAGMSNEDVPTAIGVLGDVDQFPKIGDRLQQGFLAMLLLGRAMIHPQGLSTHPAFQEGGKPVVDTSALHYDGNSQGGINGGALTAIAPDFRRAVLGVPGMGYATLLPRSVDFDVYAKIMYPAYPDESERPALLSLLQMLWDRGEANGYAGHMTTRRLPDTPAHQVLMHVAVGDHQVSEWTAEVEARTIGAVTLRRPFAPGRTLAEDPAWGIRRGTFPHRGSAIVFWDSGAAHNGVSPATNTPPREGTDPHEDPRATKAARVQKDRFLRTGSVVDVCGGGPCLSAPDNS